jgi:hypothetical protein
MKSYVVSCSTLVSCHVLTFCLTEILSTRICTTISNMLEMVVYTSLWCSGFDGWQILMYYASSQVPNDENERLGILISI